MTSKAKIEANRANARRSTGPRTAAGKARASRNALRHGLNTPIEADHAQLAIIEAWALRFSNSPSAPTGRARAAAIAQVELSRIRAAKATALRLAAEQVEAACADEPAPEATLTARALIASLPDLLKLDGYERKARSKRDKAFRALVGGAYRDQERSRARIWRNEPNPRSNGGAEPPSSAELVLGPATGRTRGPTLPPEGKELAPEGKELGQRSRARIWRNEPNPRSMRSPCPSRGRITPRHGTKARASHAYARE